MNATRKLLLILLALMVVMTAACRRQRLPAGIGEVPPPPAVRAGAGITANATIADDPRALRDLLKADLPGGGVVPIYVTVSNHDTAAVVLHNRGGLPLGEEFRGLALDAGDGPLDPIHPLEVIMRLQGRTSAPNYRGIGAWQVVGGLAVPPLAVYYIFQGGRYALRYRPLLVHSFFPATRGGLLEPVRIDPGETAAGFLYFALDPQRSPYYSGPGPEAKRGAGAKPSWNVRAESGLELAVRPCAYPSGAALGAVASEYEIAGIGRARLDEAAGGGEQESGAGSRHGPPRGDLFLLGSPRAEGGGGQAAGGGKKTRAAGAGGKLELLLGNLGDLLRSRSTDGMAALERLGGSAGEIADASRFGRYAVCAVNFKQKSRLFLADTGGDEPLLAAQLRLERRVLRVFARSDGIYVVTDDGFCGVYRYPDLRRSWYGRLGTSAGEVFLSGARLLVFGGGEVAEFECSGGRCDGPKRRVPAPVRSIGPGAAAYAAAVAGADSSVAAAGDGAAASDITTAALVHRGAGVLGDTLVLYDTASLRASARLPFPGRIETLAAVSGGFILQAEGGILLRLGAGAGGALAVSDAGWIPLRALSLVAGRAALVALARDGTLYAFEFEAARAAPLPAPHGGALKVPVGVGAETGGGPSAGGERE